MFIILKVKVPRNSQSEFISMMRNGVSKFTKKQKKVYKKMKIYMVLALHSNIRKQINIWFETFSLCIYDVRIILFISVKVELVNSGAS